MLSVHASARPERYSTARGFNISGTKEPSVYATTAVVWDGVNWRVTWGELTTSYSARVNTAGVVLDPGSVAVRERTDRPDRRQRCRFGARDVDRVCNQR